MTKHPNATHIRIVLVNPSHPGNIGAAARAMKNMGLSQLYLVQPKLFPHPDADARASGAEDILQSAIVTETLTDALVGCTFSVAASRRSRTLAWPVETPRICAERLCIEAAHHPVAIVFGNERAGLSNIELQQCQLHGQIPTVPEFGSLNLACAVQIFTYELWQAAGHNQTSMKAAPQEAKATGDEIAYFFEHFEKVLYQIEFINPSTPKRIMTRLKRMFNRAGPLRTEINLFRGILTAVEEKVKH